MHKRVNISEEERQAAEEAWNMSLDVECRALGKISGPAYDYYVIWLPWLKDEIGQATVRCPAEWLR